MIGLNLKRDEGTTNELKQVDEFVVGGSNEIRR